MTIFHMSDITESYAEYSTQAERDRGATTRNLLLKNSRHLDEYLNEFC
jgi:hypothetical protein